MQNRSMATGFGTHIMYRFYASHKIMLHDYGLKNREPNYMESVFVCLLNYLKP